MACRGRLVQWKNVRFVIFRPRGPSFETRRRSFFSDHLYLTDASIHRTSQSITQPRSQKVVAAETYHCMKGNVT